MVETAIGPHGEWVTFNAARADAAWLDGAAGITAAAITPARGSGWLQSTRVQAGALVPHFSRPGRTANCTEDLGRCASSAHGVPAQLISALGVIDATLVPGSMWMGARADR